MFYKKEREVWMKFIQEIQKQHHTEQERLLERIQKPAMISSHQQLELAEKVVHEPPKDVQELAWVGQEVPEFVKVGGDDDLEELDPQLAHIQQMTKALS